jgi:hypothetical protein
MIRFEWDEEKNKINQKKNSLDFETAKLVFDDPFCVTFVECVFRGKLAIDSDRKLATDSGLKLATCSGGKLATFPDGPEWVANIAPE